MNLVKINNLRSLLPLLKRGHHLIEEVRLPVVCDLALEEGGFVVSWALQCVVKDQEVEWYINPHYPIFENRGGTAVVRVKRNPQGGYEAIIPSTDGWGRPFTDKWEPSDEPYSDWLPISVSRFA